MESENTHIENTCIICYATSVDTPVECCKKAICSTCWTSSTRNNNRCPHCRTDATTPADADAHADIFKGNGISNHAIIIGNPLEETIANMLIWHVNNVNPATRYANRQISLNGNKGNIYIRLIEDSNNHTVIERRDRISQNIIYYHW
jgi:hypothetical protein